MTMLPEQKLSKYIAESDKAIRILMERRQVKISALNFQIALGKVLGYDERESTYVIQHKLDSEQMLELLKDNSFIFPKEIGRIKFEQSILPPNVPDVLNEETIKHKGQIWIIHKYDADPRPSNPHAHLQGVGHKMHLGNGDLYTYKNEPLNNRISKKYLLAIREKVKGIALPALEV